MTKKLSQARRDAFLAALAASGNQSLSAEKAKVSQSWVTFHRSTDPGFNAACRAAIAAARAHFEGLHAGGGGTRKPPSGWGHLGGEELVVKGTGGASFAGAPGGPRRVQIARARLRQWSPRVEERFLLALSATCNVKAACAEVGLTQASAYGHRLRWPAFARRWDEALRMGYDQIEAALIEAGCNLFSGEMPDEPAPLRAMTADHALQMLHMHKHAVRGIGKRPGLPPREPHIEEVRAEIIRRLGLFERRT